MSSKFHTRSQLKWFLFGYGIIAQKYEKQLSNELSDPNSIVIDESQEKKESSEIEIVGVEASKDKLSKKAAKELEKKEDKMARKYDRAKLRFGLNLYKAGKYIEAISHLEYICSGGTNGLKDEKAGKEREIDNRSDVHLAAARCSYYLYLQSKNHYHLESGYKHYKNCIETMGADLYAMIKLPKILYEFGKLMEAYGAFQSALELYSRILTNFPNFRGYFDAMYRSGIIGKHLSELISNPKDKEEMLNKSIDIFSFLLEAVPPSIDEKHLVLLYAKSLDNSNDPSTRFRAPGAYQALFEQCRDAKPPIARANKFKSYKEWCDDVTVWIEISEVIDKNEPLVAKSGYDLFISKFENVKKMGGELKNVQPDFWLKVAENSASYQQYDDAIKYAENGLSIDRLNNSCREFLKKTSKIHELQFKKESKAVSTLGSEWLQRVWKSGFTSKYKSFLVKELEEKFESNQYDNELRNSLSYYAKEKWRAKFLFENECAYKIQSTFKEAQKRWLWQLPIRTKYKEIASTAYRNFMKNPLNKEFRNEVLRVINHKFSPKKHIIQKVAVILRKQSAAIKCLYKSFKAYRLRNGIIKRIKNRKIKFQLKKVSAIITIQSYIRKFKARKKFKLAQETKAKLKKASKKLALLIYNRMYIYRNSTARQVRLMELKLKKAAKTLTICLPYIIKRYIKSRQYKEQETHRLQQEEEFKRLKYLEMNYVSECANKIQLLIYKFITQYGYKDLFKKSIIERKNHLYSVSIQSVLKDIIPDQNNQYHSPGIRQNSEQFIQALQQNVIVCGSNFSSTDCFMLSAIVRHKNSRVNKLIFENVDGMHPTFEFDLLPAIVQNKSLKNIMLIGGHWTENFIAGLIQIIQTENSRIIDVSIENMKHGRNFNVRFSKTIAALVSDYFNYSLPGLVNLSLHNVQLQNEHVLPIGEALKLNTSIKYLHLSCNLIEDDGIYSIFNAINLNSKSSVIFIDLMANFITLKKKIRSLFFNYKSPILLKVIRICLYSNPIKYPYEPCKDNFQNLLVLTTKDNFETGATKKSKKAKNIRNLSRSVAVHQGSWMSMEK